MSLERAREAATRLSLVRAREAYAEVIDHAHEHGNLAFKSLPGEFESPSSIPLYQSPDYEGRKGSTYRLMYVDGDLAWARESDHWGKLGGIDGTEPFEWTLDGAEHYGSRVAGYVLLEDLAAPVLDAVSGLARVKLAGALLEKLEEYRGANEMKPLERLRLVGVINALVAELGGKPQAEPGESPAIKVLREIAQGLRDGESLAELYGLMQEAANDMQRGKGMMAHVEELCHDAITHWAELESKDAP